MMPVGVELPLVSLTLADSVTAVPAVAVAGVAVNVVDVVARTGVLAMVKLSAAETEAA